MDHFYFGKHKFTVLIGEDDSLWLVAKELCEYLRLTQTHKAVKELPADCKQRVMIDAFKSKGRGGDNGVRIIVDEEGANRMISKSNKPIAQEFQS